MAEKFLLANWHMHRELPIAVVSIYPSEVAKFVYDETIVMSTEEFDQFLKELVADSNDNIGKTMIEAARRYIYAKLHREEPSQG